MTVTSESRELTVSKPHPIPDRAPQFDVEFLGETLCDGTRGDPAGLGVADGAVDATAEFEADLGQLGGLAGSRLPRDDDDLMVTDGGRDVVLAFDDRQVFRIGDLGQQPEPSFTPGRERRNPLGGIRAWGNCPRAAAPLRR
ncbi:MAG: hypothetical protein V9F04_06075 [Dermatophilaceae bacterium]